MKCSVSLASPPPMDAGGGSGSLAITTQPECAWDASSNVNWISALAPATGQGTANVSFRVDPNEGGSAREGMIVVNGEQARVSQRAPCRYNLGPANQNVDSGGGTRSMTIATASECAWAATTDVNWISFTSPTSGSGDATVTFRVNANDGAQRTGAIVVGSQRVLVTQASGGGPPGPPTPPQSPCTYSLSPTSDIVSSNEGSGSVTVTASRSTCAWTAVSNDRWLLISSGASGSGTGSVTYRSLANTGGMRTGSLTIAGLTFTVRQAAGGGQAPDPPPPPPPPAPPPPPQNVECSYSVAPSTQQVNKGAGSDTITVSTTSGCAWTAASNTDWITVTSGAGGVGSGTVTFAYAQNEGLEREGSLTAAGRTAIVTQKGEKKDKKDDSDEQ